MFLVWKTAAALTCSSLCSRAARVYASCCSPPTLHTSLSHNGRHVLNSKCLRRCPTVASYPSLTFPGLQSASRQLSECASPARPDARPGRVQPVQVQSRGIILDRTCHPRPSKLDLDWTGSPVRAPKSDGGRTGRAIPNPAVGEPVSSHAVGSVRLLGEEECASVLLSGQSGR